MTTGAELVKARRAAALIEHGIVDFLTDVERSLVESMAARVLSDTMTREQAEAAWIRLGQLRTLRAEAERRARSLQPLSIQTNGGAP